MVISHKSDTQLTRELMTLRGFQWVYGLEGDPFALLLRAESDDPHELGRRVRDHGALFRSSTSAWVAAAHESAAKILWDPRLSAQPQDAAASGDPADGKTEDPASGDDPMPWDIPSLDKVLPLDDACLNMSGRENARLAGLVETAMNTELEEFHTASIARIRRRRSSGLDGEFDFAIDYARPIVAAATCALLGLDQDASERFARLSAGSAAAQDAMLCPPQLGTARELVTSIADIRELATELTRMKRNAPGDDLVSGLLGARRDEEAARADAIAVFLMLSVAGVESTTNLLCNALSALLDHSEQWSRLCRAPHLAASAIEETLRFAPPVRLQRLFAREDIDLFDHRIESGGMVVVMIEAANRDPAAYPDPDAFHLTRAITPDHLSLHRNTYAGVIAPIVRLQATTMLAGVATDMPGIHGAGDVLRRLRSPVSGGVVRMPVAVT
ncbi:P450-derived glycosyltransferase activator [Spirillospora sp. NBC_00431]